MCVYKLIKKCLTVNHKNLETIIANIFEKYVSKIKEIQIITNIQFNL